MEPQHVSTALEGCFTDRALSNQGIFIISKKSLMALSRRFRKAHLPTPSAALTHVFIMLVASAPDLSSTEILTYNK
jgi:hypothetical protein